MRLRGRIVICTVYGRRDTWKWLKPSLALRAGIVNDMLAVPDLERQIRTKPAARDCCVMMNNDLKRRHRPVGGVCNQMIKGDE